MKPVVLLDCDGVLSNFVGGLLSIVNAERGTSYDPKDCTDWDIGKAFDLEWGYISSICERPGFCADLQQFPGTRSAMLTLQGVADVYVVTTPWTGPHWMFERTNWLNSHFGIPAKNVLHCHNKCLVHGDLLVDDKAETVVAWTKRWSRMGSRGIVWDAPYNSTIELPRRKCISRCSDWSTVIATVQEMAT